MDAKTGHLLIDGYNVVHAWPDLMHQFGRDFDAARSWLIEQVRTIHDQEGLNVSLVFDGKGSDITLEYPGNEETFTVIFSRQGLTADGVIEQIVSRHPNSNKCVVISQDNMICESVRAVGAVAFGVDYLVDWVARCEKQQSRVVQSNNKRIQKKWKLSNPWDVLE